MNRIEHNKRTWTLENFISEKECQDLILFSEMRGYQEAEVSLGSGAKMMKSIRNNSRVIYEDPALAGRLWAKLQQQCPATFGDWEAVGLNEQFRFYRYESAERFKRHMDGRFRRNEHEESRITFMIYLNEDFAGGATAFDDFTIVPKTGSALCFVHEQKHEGCPVESGVKYVLRSDVMYRRSM